MNPSDQNEKLSSMKWIPIFIAVLLAAVFASAQIKTEQVDIVKPYQPLLADALKISLEAKPASVDSSLQPLQYNVHTTLMNVPFTPNEIKPLAMPKATVTALQNNMVKLGFGTQLTPLAEVYLNNGRSDKFNYGLQLNHLSSNGEQQLQNFSDNTASFFATSYFKGTALTGKVGYDRHVVNFFGFENDFNPIPDSLSVKEPMQNIFFAAGLSNAKKNKAEMDYRFNFDFHHFNAKPDASFLNENKEDVFSFQTQLNKVFNDIHNAHIDFSVEHQNMNAASQTLFNVTPYYKLNQKDFDLKVGVNVTSDSKSVKLFPELEGEYKLIGEYLIPYAGFTGSWKPELLADVYHINPFITGFAQGNVQQSEIFGGLRGSYGNNIYYNLRIGYQTLSDAIFYVPNDSLVNPIVFDAIHYGGVKMLRLYGELGYKESERINILLSGEVNNYNLDFNDEPWGVPKNKLSLSVSYNIQQKIVLKAEAYAWSGVFTLPAGDSVPQQLKGTVDLNFSATYNYKKNFSFFAIFNNIAAQKYQRWYRYPSYGFQAIGGVAVKF